MGKWDKYKFTMFIVMLFSTWVAAGMSADYGTYFFDMFFMVFGLLSFCILCFVVLLDFLYISWGDVEICK